MPYFLFSPKYDVPRNQRFTHDPILHKIAMILAKSFKTFVAVALAVLAQNTQFFHFRLNWEKFRVVSGLIFVLIFG